MTDTPVRISLRGEFVPTPKSTVEDFREFFRSLSADFGYDPQMDAHNDFSWAFHDMVFGCAHPHSTTEIVTVSATIAQSHPKALVPLVFWICHSLELLGELDVSAISLNFPKGSFDRPIKQSPRHLQLLPRTAPDNFTLDICPAESHSHDIIITLIQRISQIPFPSFKIDTATFPPTPVGNKKWRLHGRICRWDYLEMSYLFYTVVYEMPDTIYELSLTRA